MLIVFIFLIFVKSKNSPSFYIKTNDGNYLRQLKNNKRLYFTDKQNEAMSFVLKENKDTGKNSFKVNDSDNHLLSFVKSKDEEGDKRQYIGEILKNSSNSKSIYEFTIIDNKNGRFLIKCSSKKKDLCVSYMRNNNLTNFITLVPCNREDNNQVWKFEKNDEVEKLSDLKLSLSDDEKKSSSDNSSSDSSESDSEKDECKENECNKCDKLISKGFDLYLLQNPNYMPKEVKRNVKIISRKTCKSKKNQNGSQNLNFSHSFDLSQNPNQVAMNDSDKNKYSPVQENNNLIINSANRGPIVKDMLNSINNTTFKVSQDDEADDVEDMRNFFRFFSEAMNDQDNISRKNKNRSISSKELQHNNFNIKISNDEFQNDNSDSKDLNKNNQELGDGKLIVSKISKEKNEGKPEFDKKSEIVKNLKNRQGDVGISEQISKNLPDSKRKDIEDAAREKVSDCENKNAKALIKRNASGSYKIDLKDCEKEKNKEKNELFDPEENNKFSKVDNAMEKNTMFVPGSKNSTLDRKNALKDELFTPTEKTIKGSYLFEPKN